jgi:hypothetical protein
MFRRLGFEEEKKEIEPKDKTLSRFVPTKPKIRNMYSRFKAKVRNESPAKQKLLAALFLGLCGFVFVLTGRSESSSLSKLRVTSKPQNAKNAAAAAAAVSKIVTNDEGTIVYSCPDFEDEKNSHGENFEENYGSVSNTITTDKEEFLATFRTTEFDAWEKTYDQIKAGMKPFKAKYYPKYLKDGSHLYESACGIGLNLFMTLEILKESKQNITGVTVYGNEYVTKSVEKARAVVLADGVLPPGNKMGNICPGDSTNLDFVPKNTFDVVYTGYITPQMDLLDLHEDNPEWDDWTEYDQVCSALWRSEAPSRQSPNQKSKDWMGLYLWEAMVQKQRDWFGSWVREMSSIAKPGAPIMIEQVSLPYCLNQKDWGGVAKAFWHEAAVSNVYGWNVDPNSIEFMDDEVHDLRYNIFMLKNKH